jgi:fatty acid desaturase
VAAQRLPPPDRTNALPAIVVGTVGWLIALVVLLATHTQGWWRWVCLTGFLLGVVGVPIMSRYQRVHG